MEQGVREASKIGAIMLRPRFIAYQTDAAVIIMIIIMLASSVALIHVSSPEYRVRTIVGANAIAYDWQVANIEKGLAADDAPSYWGIKIPRISLQNPGHIVAIDLKFSDKHLDRNLVDAISQLQALRWVVVDCTRATEADRNYLRSRAHGRFEVLDICE